jgi:hypothetical protein
MMVLNKCEHGVSWVKMDGQRIQDGVNPLERSLVKRQIPARTGKVEQIAARSPARIGHQRPIHVATPANLCRHNHAQFIILGIKRRLDGLFKVLGSDRCQKGQYIFQLF